MLLLMSSSLIDIHPSDLDPDSLPTNRASILLAGAHVSALQGSLYFPPPGGVVIGRRRVDTHILALNKLGALFSYNDCFHFLPSTKRSRNLLDEASVTATENTIMAAVKAEGRTIIRNAASDRIFSSLVSVHQSAGC
jgi:UDP-N-acetylglucosamine 1-carboxyvinyltransferase